MSKLNMMPRLFLLCGAVLLLSGCGGRYQLGSPGKIPFESIYVMPVINESFAPQAHTVLSGQIRSFIIQDGRVRLVSDPARADAVLVVRLKDFNRFSETVAGEDTARALSTELDLTAEFSLHRGDTAQTFFADRTARASGYVYNRNLSGTTAPADLRQDSLEGETQLMPIITRDLAREIADAVLHVW